MELKVIDLSPYLVDKGEKAGRNIIFKYLITMVT